MANIIICIAYATLLLQYTVAVISHECVDQIVILPHNIPLLSDMA